jgi:hypothetical protein
LAVASSVACPFSYNGVVTTRWGLKYNNRTKIRPLPTPNVAWFHGKATIFCAIILK